MPLPVPKLDDRTFQDLVNETKRLIPRYCPEWTDHNVSDPGVTMIELFAYMVDLLLYRVNRVPVRNYIKWLDMLGVKLEPPRPARADLTFYLTGPQPSTVTIAAGTESATVRTESQEAIGFSTDADLTIHVPTLFQLLVNRDGYTYHDYTPALRNPTLNIGIFQDPPQPNDAIYYGFHEDLRGHILRMDLDSMTEGIGVNPKDPPISWEYWDGPEQAWMPMGVETDTTGGLNRPGEVVLHVPFGARPRDLDGRVAFWVRTRATAPRRDQPGYSAAPRIKRIVTESLGGTVPASQVYHIEDEFLGRSNGKPAQEWQLNSPPVLARQPGEVLEVEDDNGRLVPWTEVEDFGQSGPGDQHYTLDSLTGVIRFGPEVRDAGGRVIHYGAFPPEGRVLRMSSYRTGGGVRGNVGRNTITVMKSSIPYVAGVMNAAPAIGGEDAESLEQAMLRGPSMLRARSRAVTCDDYEYLARQASSEVARARCVPPTAEQVAAGRGVIRVLLVPDTPHKDDEIPLAELLLSPSTQSYIMAYLDERRIVTAQVQIDTPEYRLVSIEATVAADRRTPKEALRGEIERALYRFINPVHGGPDGNGWPWDRNLYASEVTALIHNIEGVEHVENVRLSVADMVTGARTVVEGNVPCPTNGMLVSYGHTVTVR
jgi:predicted phage baseplate assembly protein